MTEPTRVAFNTLEQVLAADWNRVGSLAGKAALDRMIEIEQGFFTFAPRSVVLRGLLATAGAGMSTDLSSGSFARLDNAPPANQSRYRYGELAATLNLPHVAADPVLPRIDLIHAAETQTAADTTTRNVLQLPARTVSPQLVPKTQGPTMNVQVLPGTPNILPVIPPTPAGRIALCAVYVPGAAVAITDNFIMDLRVVFQPSAISRAHQRDHGLYVGPGAGRNNGFFTSGRAVINGAQVELADDLQFAHAAMTSDGAGALAANTTYHFYAVCAGYGDPVGKNIPSRFVPIVTTIAPNPDGRPSAGILYRPLFQHGNTDVRVSTTNALYIGTLHSDDGSLYQIGGDGIPLNRDGTSGATNICPAAGPQGFPGLAPGWIKKTDLQWIDATTVRLPLSCPVLAGNVGLASQMDAVMPTSLVAGDAEAASTWYYVYIRTRISAAAQTRGTVRNYVLLLSSEAPTVLGQKPTPEAGFQSQDYQFCGSVFNNASSDFEEFAKTGDIVLFRAERIAYSAVLPALPTRDTITFPAVPASSRKVIASITGTGRATIAGQCVGETDLFAPGIGSAPIFTRVGVNFVAANPLDRLGFSMGHLMIPVDAAQAEIGRTAGLNLTEISLTLFQHGYVENIESPDV